jgi:hypothetical protein
VVAVVVLSIAIWAVFALLDAIGIDTGAATAIVVVLIVVTGIATGGKIERWWKARGRGRGGSSPAA